MSTFVPVRLCDRNSHSVLSPHYTVTELLVHFHYTADKFERSQETIPHSEWQTPWNTTIKLACMCTYLNLHSFTKSAVCVLSHAVGPCWVSHRAFEYVWWICLQSRRGRSCSYCLFYFMFDLCCCAIFIHFHTQVRQGKVREDGSPLPECHYILDLLCHHMTG